MRSLSNKFRHHHNLPMILKDIILKVRWLFRLPFGLIIKTEFQKDINTIFDEYHIPEGVIHSGKCIAGTRNSSCIWRSKE